MNKIKVKQQNYYGFRHDKVKLNFEGKPEYVNDFTVKNTDGEPVVVAVYKSKKPNRKKGHKKYMLLMRNSEGGIVAGMDYSEIRKYRYRKAIQCLACNTVIYSLNRHNFHKCGCDNEAMIDGGTDYSRYGAKDMTKIKMVTLDLLKNKIVKP